MSPAEQDREQERDSIKAEFMRERGYWRPWTETLLRERPRFVQQYARYAGHPARTGPLTERMVELVYVALDASASHLFESGLRTHMQKALQCGATTDDVFDVLHLVAAQGLEAVVQAAALLAEETAPGLPSSGLDPMAALASLDPAFAQVVQEFLVLGKPGQGLTDAEQCLIRLALNACFTAQNQQAVRQLIRQGISLGLSTTHLLQAIQMGAHLSVHGTAMGAQIHESLREERSV